MKIYTVTYITAESGNRVYVDKNETKVFTDKDKALAYFQKLRRRYRISNYCVCIEPEIIEEGRNIKYFTRHYGGNQTVRVKFQVHNVKPDSEE